METAKTLVINIVTWNSARYLPKLLESLDAQTSKDFTVTVVDNASTDGTLEWLAERPDITLLRNFRNQGFSRAHNQAITLAMSRWGGPSDSLEPSRESKDLDGRYVLVANPDLEFSPDAVERLISYMNAHTDVDACAPKLLRATVTLTEDERRETERTNIIDAMGITLTKGRRPVDRGAGQEDKGQFDSEMEVFGVSGACALYRASSLKRARIGEEYFDEDFFAYQEDMDLSWRMRLLGMKLVVVPFVTVWHHRKAQGMKTGNWFTAWLNRRRKPPIVNFLSSRNHGWLLLKNEHVSNALLYLPWWFVYECAKLLVSLTSWAQIRGQFATVLGVPKMWKKRRLLMARRKASAAEIRKWFV